MINYTSVYREVIERGNLKKYIDDCGKDINLNGSCCLVEYVSERGEEGVYINLDVGDDYKTPSFIVSGDSDRDLMIYRNIEEAYDDFKSRLGDI